MLKKYFYYLEIIFVLLSASSALSQELHHSMISCQGDNFVSSEGLRVSYTIGQQTISGTTSGSFVFQQGFQQINWGKQIAQNTVNIITTTYPNPFVDYVIFSFSKTPGSKINVLVFDILGRLVHSESVLNEENVISIDLRKLSSAEYLVKLSSDNFIHSTKIIKQ